MNSSYTHHSSLIYDKLSSVLQNSTTVLSEYLHQVRLFSFALLLTSTKTCDKMLHNELMVI